MHFKELFILDGKKSNLEENDVARRNTIATLLSDWGLITFVQKAAAEPIAPLRQIKIIPFKDLPVPTGEFNVGTRIYNWKDETREEWFTEEEGDIRKIVVQVWYPSLDVADEKMSYLDLSLGFIFPILLQLIFSSFFEIS